MRMRMILAMIEMNFSSRFVKLHNRVERKHPAQFLGQQLKQLPRIAMPPNRLGNANQRPIARANRRPDNAISCRDEPHMSILDVPSRFLDATK